MNRTTLTATKEKTTHSHTSLDRGSKKLNILGTCLTGFFIIILIPSVANGFVKSTTLCRSAVIVNGAMAISASYRKVFITLVRKFLILTAVIRMRSKFYTLSLLYKFPITVQTLINFFISVLPARTFLFLKRFNRFLDRIRTVKINSYYFAVRTGSVTCANSSNIQTVRLLSFCIYYFLLHWSNRTFMNN